MLLEQMLINPDMSAGRELKDFDRGHEQIGRHILSSTPLQELLTLQQRAVEKREWRIGYAVNLKLLTTVGNAECEQKFPAYDVLRARHLTNTYGEIVEAGLLLSEKRRNTNYTPEDSNHWETFFGTLLSSIYLQARQAYACEFFIEHAPWKKAVLSEAEYLFIIDTARSLAHDYFSLRSEQEMTDEETSYALESVQVVPEEVYPISSRERSALEGMLSEKAIRALRKDITTFVLSQQRPYEARMTHLQSAYDQSEDEYRIARSHIAHHSKNKARMEPAPTPEFLDTTFTN